LKEYDIPGLRESPAAPNAQTAFFEFAEQIMHNQI
jgi:hypothetical protein